LRAYRFQWPALDAVFLIGLMRASMVAIIAGCALWGLSALGRRITGSDVNRKVGVE